MAGTKRRAKAFDEREAAAALRRVVESLPMLERVAAYLRGYADALDHPRQR